MDLDASRCPLCGERNDCAVAAGRDATECWCVSEIFPHSLLDQVPEAARDRVCICAACARKHADNVE